MILLIPIALLVLTLVVRAVFRAYRRRRAASELHGDWWPAFERDLREYMSQTWRSAREAERHG